MRFEDGTGALPPRHSVDLSWSARPSAGVIGYNVYRKTSGQYSRINASLEARTTYTDSAVEAGITYFYIVTAVDENGAESAYSDTFKVVIPTP